MSVHRISCTKYSPVHATTFLAIVAAVFLGTFAQKDQKQQIAIIDRDAFLIENVFKREVYQGV
jgi:hypothetical protein